jgi:hypothetical protein
MSPASPAPMRSTTTAVTHCLESVPMGGGGGELWMHRPVQLAGNMYKATRVYVIAELSWGGPSFHHPPPPTHLSSERQLRASCGALHRSPVDGGTLAIAKGPVDRSELPMGRWRRKEMLQHAYPHVAHLNHGLRVRKGIRCALRRCFSGLCFWAFSGPCFLCMRSA